MESRAKQRLTGAIILVALFVLLVPELLTGPRAAHPDAQAPDQGMRRYTIDLDAQRANSAPAAPAAEAPVVLPPVEAPTNATPGRAVPGEAATPESGAPPVQAAAGNPMAPSSRSEKAPENVAATAATAATAAQTQVRAEPPHATTANRPVDSGTFAVQLGTFGKRENAERLAREMTAKGFAAFVMPTTANGHELYRVRVGPTRDRAAAEALAAQLKRVGQPGSIVPIS
jgi:DedD protein